MQKNIIDNFKNYLKLNLNSQSSERTYFTIINKFFNNYTEFNQGNVNDFLVKVINSKVKPGTFNIYCVALKHFAKATSTEINIPKLKKVTTNINRTYLTKDEIEIEILPYFRFLFNDAEKRQLIIRFMFLTGLRLGEIANLKKSDFNFQKDEIYIHYTKSHQDRTVFIHPFIKADILKEFELHSNIESAFNVNREYIKYIFQIINTQLNYKKKITPHTLRHSCAKYLLDQGMKINELQKFLGHNDLNTTAIYITVDHDELKSSYLQKIKYKNKQKINKRRSNEKLHPKNSKR